MRTTIRLDEALLAEAKAEALRTGRTLKAVIEDALRASLARRGEPGGDGPSRELPTFAGRRLLPGVDLDSSASLLKLMESRPVP